MTDPMRFAERLARIEERAKAIEDNTKDILAKLDRYDARIRVLEGNDRVISVVGGVAVLLVPVAVEVILRHF